MSEEVEAVFSEDVSRVTLEAAQGPVCELHCSKVTVLVRSDNGELVPRRIRMLTTKRDFPVLAQRLYRKHAVDQRVDEERMQISLFLARLYRLVYLKQWVLTGHDILGHGRRWKDRERQRERQEELISDIAAKYRGTAWERLLQMHALGAVGEDTPHDDDLKRATTVPHGRYIIQASSWLEPLGEPPAEPLDDEELRFIGGLMECERRWWPQEGDLMQTHPDDQDARARGAVRLYQKRLRQRLHNLRRAKRRDGPRDQWLIARALWQGREEFLFQFEQAALMMCRALEHCTEFTPLERKAFRLVHTMQWNGSMGIFRVDELMQGFLRMDAFDLPLTLFACLLGLAQGDGQFDRHLVCSMWYHYLRTAPGALTMERATDKKPSTPPRELPEGDKLREELTVRGARGTGAGVPWAEVHDAEWGIRALNQLGSRKRRQAMRFRLAGMTQADAAPFAECSVDTVRRAEREMLQLMERLLSNDE